MKWTSEKPRTGGSMTQAYDSACAELAESFLRDSNCPPAELEAAIHELAIAIQQTIEDFMSACMYE